MQLPPSHSSPAGQSWLVVHAGVGGVQRLRHRRRAALDFFLRHFWAQLVASVPARCGAACPVPWRCLPLPFPWPLPAASGAASRPALTSAPLRTASRVRRCAARENATVSWSNRF
jgi:hypothetical protein